MRAFSLIVVIIAAVAAAACKDSLITKADFKEEYVFYSILNGRDSLQTVYLARSYDALDFNPINNTDDRAITNAQVVINFDGKNYIMRDTALDRKDTTRYKGKYHLYYIKGIDFNSTKTGYDTLPVNISAVIPGGKVINASVKSIPGKQVYFGQNKYEYPSFKKDFSYSFNWRFIYNPGIIGKYYYLPVFELSYSQLINGLAVKKTINIPYSINVLNGREVIVPAGITRNTYIDFWERWIDYALQKLSEGDPNKNNYLIHNLKFKLRILDKDLANYIAANTTYEDEFSVRIDAPDFKNIKGALGVIGFFTTQEIEFELDRIFIESKGYQFIKSSD